MNTTKRESARADKDVLALADTALSLGRLLVYTRRMMVIRFCVAIFICLCAPICTIAWCWRGRKSRAISILLVLVCVAHTGVVWGQQNGPTTVLLTSGTSWNPPANFNNSHYTIYLIGAGNNGAAGVSSTQGGGGGAGGDTVGFSQASGVTFSNGTAVTYQIGTPGGGVSTTGATIFGGATCATATACAVGGAAASGATGGAAGNTANDTVPSGAAAHAGCAGGTTISTHGGGGGGGAAYPIAACSAGGAGGVGTGGAGGNSGEGSTTPGGTGGTSGAACTAGAAGIIGGATGAVPTTDYGWASGGGGAASNNHTGCAGGNYGAGGGGGYSTTSNSGGSGGGGAIFITWWPVTNACVQPSFNNSCTDTSVSCTLPSSVTAGHSILIAGSITQPTASGAPTGISLTCSHSICTEEDKGSSATAYADVGLCPYDTGGTDVCTLNFTTSGTGCYEVIQAIEEPPLNHLDVSNHATSAGTTTTTVGNVTTTDPNDVLFANAVVSNAGLGSSAFYNSFIDLCDFGGQACDPQVGNTDCQSSGHPWACCTGAGTGGCTFLQVNAASINLPSALATASYTGTYWVTGTSAPAAGAIMAVDLVATATPTATPTLTPAGTCTPSATISLLNSSKHILNGTASAVTGKGANWYAWAIDNNASDFVVNNFNGGSASATLAAVNRTIRIVDNNGLVCVGSDSATPACSSLPCNATTVRVCNTEGSVAGCTESAVSASPSMSVQIEDANGFIDDTIP